MFTIDKDNVRVITACIAWLKIYIQLFSICDKLKRYNYYYYYILIFTCSNESRSGPTLLFKLRTLYLCKGRSKRSKEFLFKFSALLIYTTW